MSSQLSVAVKGGKGRISTPEGAEPCAAFCPSQSPATVGTAAPAQGPGAALCSTRCQLPAHTTLCSLLHHSKTLFIGNKKADSFMFKANKQTNKPLQNQCMVDKVLYLKELVFHQLCLCAALYNSNSEQCQKMAGMSLEQHMQDRTIFINKALPVISLARLEQQCPGTR